MCRMAARYATAHQRTKSRFLRITLPSERPTSFRDPKVWEVLEDEILWDLVRRRRAEGNKTLKLWSAGCCTGEEPYSMAMVLRRLLHDIENWDITVLGTDINPHFLKKAKSGLYGDCLSASPRQASKRSSFTRSTTASSSSSTKSSRWSNFISTI